MAASDDFRKQLKAGNIKEALALALSKAVELKITTWVASGSDDLEETNAKPGHRLRTHIKSIEGKIENEIGDQFIGNGPYRELQQFHTEQVAESNKIIQSNLQSLQKLFETLVTLRYQGATPPVIIEPESLDDESQLLPSAGESTQEASENRGTEREDTSDTEDDEDDWDDSVLDLLESLPVPPPPTQESLTSQLDENWRDFMEETPESGATQLNSPGNQNWETLRREDFEPPPTSPKSNFEASSSQFEQNWRDFIGAAPEHLPSATDLLLEREDEIVIRPEVELPLTSLEADSEASRIPTDEDRGDSVEDDAEALLTPPGLPVTPVWETLAQEDAESPSISPEADIEVSSAQRDEDWGWEDLGAAQLQPEATVSDSLPHDRVTLTPNDSELPFSPALNLDTSRSELEDEEWGDFLEEEPEPQPTAPELPVNQDRVTLTPDESESPFSPALNLDTPRSELEDEDWGDFLEEEPEPQPTAPELPVNQDRVILTPDDSELPFSPALNLDTSRSELEDEDWGDFLDEQPEPQPTAPELPVNQDRVTLTPDESESSFSPALNLDTPRSELEDEDWGDFLDEQPEPQPTVPELPVNQDRVTLAPEQVESPSLSASPTIEVSQPAINDEDWGDLAEDEPESEYDRPIPSLDALQLEEDEEWDDWVVEESDPLQDAPTLDMELLDLGENRNWDDFEDDSNPFATASDSSDSVSYSENIGADEDWDDFTTSELKPHSASPDAGTTDLSTQTGENNLPTQPQQEPDRGVVSRDSDSVVKSEDDLDIKPQTVEKRVPPPPPPSRFPNQNTEK